LEPEDLATLAGLLTQWRQERGPQDPEVHDGTISLHAVITDVEQEYSELTGEDPE
jgi:hypothetical protein